MIRRDNCAIAHTDSRRTVFDPSKILDNTTGTWYAHNIICIKDGAARLGNHRHDYNELFFTPTGGIVWGLEKIGRIEQPAGSIIFIPSGVAHIAAGVVGSVMMGYGDAPFDPKRLIRVDDGLAGTLESYIR